MAGLLVAVSGLSGAGKTAVVQELIKRNPTWKRFVTTTTREPRDGEVDGVDYHFVTKATFFELQAQGRMFESKEHYGAWYGGTNDVLDDLEQHDVVLIIMDPEGVNRAHAVMRQMCRCRTILLRREEQDRHTSLHARRSSDADTRTRIEEDITIMDTINVSLVFDYCISNEGALDQTVDYMEYVVRQNL